MTVFKISLRWSDKKDSLKLMEIFLIVCKRCNKIILVEELLIHSNSD